MAKSVQYQNPYLIDLLVCLVKKKVGATDELSKNHFDKIGEASASVDSVKHFFTDKHLISGDTNINTYYFATKKTLNKYCEYIGEVDWKTFCNAEKENSLSFEPNLSTKSTTTHEARLRYYKYYEKHKANIQIAIQSHEKIQIARKREYEIPQIEVKTNGLKLLKKLDKIQETLTTHPPINFDLIARHRQLTRDIKQLNQEFEEIRQKKEKIEKTIANKTDEEVIELLTDQVQELGVKLLLIDGQRSTQQKELLQLEENAKRFFIFINNDVESKDAVLLKVREFINNGNWKEIEALLNSSDLQEEEEAIKNDAEHKYQALSEKLLAKAQLTHINKTNPNWFAEAHTYYQKAVSLHESYGTCYSFAFFLREHNQHDEAIHYCQKALNLDADSGQTAKVLNNLAALHYAKNEIVEAEEEFQKALGIFRKLSLLNPQVYEPDVAMTLNGLAALHYAKNEIVEAEKEFQEAIRIFRKLAILNPQVYERMVAMALNNLANLHYAKNEIAEAEQAYREALEICRKLAILNPQVYEPKVAGTLNNLAALYYAKNEIVEAEQAYREALSIRRKLAILNIHIYESDVAMTLNGLAILHIDRNEIVEAEEEFQEALEIYRKLGLLNPQEYDALVAMTLNNLANLYSTKNEIVEAEQAYREALEIHLVLAKRNPSIYQLPLATALINFSYFCLLQNDKYSSLHSSFEAYKNAIIYVQYVPKALEIVHDAIQAWAAWGEDLSKYLEDKNDEDG